VAAASRARSGGLGSRATMKVVLTDPEAGLVRWFYDDAWNRWDDRRVGDLLADDFEFRGSLGDEVRGPDGWRSYRDHVREAVPDFHNEIVDLVTSPGRAAVRLWCSGHHRGVLLGRAGRGEPIAYSAAAFFRFDGGQLRSAWVLGDLDALRTQLDR
jgi:predicted ester cyclase